MLNACASYLQEEPVSSRDIENAAREQAALLARKIKNAPDLRCPHRILIARCLLQFRLKCPFLCSNASLVGLCGAQYDCPPA
eukprot:m.241464 g.241464  ORF g.241464 m.241464 type:complete len:82 (-) comp10939_c1_seq35:1458-1703(-)